MASGERRAAPDNLDPLVDTLSNVVGILVIVVVLTQIQLGDALTRVAELDRQRAIQEENEARALPLAAQSLADRREQLLLRTEAEAEEAAKLAQILLERLSALPPSSAAVATSDAALAARVDAARAALAEAREARDRRAAYAAELERVPDRMVARLPNPTVVEGRESWILVRHGRVYLADREQLYDEASRAIQRILADGGSRYVRQDEFESVAHYLRKRDVGVGNFRWRFETEPENRVVLAWRSRDEGIERTRLASDPRLRAWLAERSPELDFILFQVWSDSFETYLEARKLVEQAGFRAGWRGRSEDEEIRLPLSFGPKPPPLRRIEVD